LEEYLATLVRDFYKGILRLIERSVERTPVMAAVVTNGGPNSAANARADIAAEIHRHMDTAAKEAAAFVGRENILKQVN